ncbi:MAG: hypothetical protein RIR00_2454 [Pseudomonadota bacterium]
MKSTLANGKRHGPALALLAALAGAPGHGYAAPTDESSLPDSLRSGHVAEIVGPENDTAYARGSLSLVRTSFGRASLYVAWRLMQLPAGAVANESHERQRDWVKGQLGRPGPDEVKTWLKARSTLLTTPPRVAPDYYRPAVINTTLGDLEYEEGQCGADAFIFATRILESLSKDSALTDAHRRSWISAQDAVFARCTWKPGTPLPAAPASPAADAPEKLRALHAYQQASALFYEDRYAAAREQFDAIAATANHPLRPWAELGALRSLLREVSRDREWQAAMDDAWVGKKLRGDEYRAALAGARARRTARIDATFKDMEARINRIVADPSLAAVHGPVRYTLRRAVIQFKPEFPFRAAMQELDQPTANPYTKGALDLFMQLYPSVLPERPDGELATALRKRPWLDFIYTVQACTDTPAAKNDALCAREHAYALSRWTQGQDNTWLLATLMTAKTGSPELMAAAEAARAVTTDRPEWASLQFHAARAFRTSNRPTEARIALDALTNSTALSRRDRKWVEAERREL